MPSKKLALEWKKRTEERLVEWFIDVYDLKRLGKSGGISWGIHGGSNSDRELVVWHHFRNITANDCVAVERDLMAILKPYAELYNKLVAVHGEDGE